MGRVGQRGQDHLVSADVRLGVGLTLLSTIALAALTVAGVGQRRAVLLAAIRAGVQLTLIAAALRGVFAAPATSIAVVAVMFTVATATATRRLRDLPGATIAVVVSCGVGAAITIGIIVGLPTLTRDVRTLVAVFGIVIGGTMTAATFTGRHLAGGIHRRRDEFEAWLSIGTRPISSAPAEQSSRSSQLPVDLKPRPMGRSPELREISRTLSTNTGRRESRSSSSVTTPRSQQRRRMTSFLQSQQAVVRLLR
jgi:ABC-type iron transport system FetAB permease component